MKRSADNPLGTRATAPASSSGAAAEIRALLIESDGRFAASVGEILTQNGVRLTEIRADSVGWRKLPNDRFDILLVDIISSGITGWMALQKIRARRPTPMIMVVEPGQDEDKIVCMEFGADDCLTNPVNPRELLARIRAVLRRYRGALPSGAQQFAAGGLVIDFAAELVTVDGVHSKLTPHQYALVVALARNVGHVIAREPLLELIKGVGGAEESFDRAIDIHISRLRAKIEHDPRHPRYVKTIRGLGYMLSRTG